jgi:hypothetical protein
VGFLESASYFATQILKPLRDFADGLELTLTLPLIDTLLLAASHPDKGVDDFARMADVGPGTISRWLQDLSDIDRRGKPGLDWLCDRSYMIGDPWPAS